MVSLNSKRTHWRGGCRGLTIPLTDVTVPASECHVTGSCRSDCAKASLDLLVRGACRRRHALGPRSGRTASLPPRMPRSSVQAAAAASTSTIRVARGVTPIDQPLRWRCSISGTPATAPTAGSCPSPTEAECDPPSWDMAQSRQDGHITSRARLAFGQMETNAEDPVIEVRLSDGRIRLRSVDGAQYRLLLPSGARETVVLDREQVMQMAAGRASSRLHFGSRDSLHRVVSFELHPGGMA